jgi:3-hydroxyisobutyrate dehydrogenase-like beta-hydroxyacid dehydrogenase
MSQSIAFIGMGLMGQPMSLNLVNAGFTVTVFNRDRSKAEPLERAGAKVALNPGDAARNADVVYLIVSDSAAVEAVVAGKDGFLETLRPGAVVIDSSTISPVVSQRLAAKVSAKGGRWLDAPVTGSKHLAAKGELTFMIGGDRDVLDAMMPVLNALGKKFIHCGPQGAGLAAKLAQNAIQATMVEIFAEAFVMATKAGVRPEALLEVIQSSLARSGLIDFKAPFVFKGDFSPYFSLKLMHKDLNLAIENAYALNVPMPATATVKETYGLAKAQGKGDLDYAAVITLFEEVSGVTVRATEKT